MNDIADSPENQLQAMLRVLWKNNRATIDERVQRLRETQARLSADQLDPVTRKEAESAAHKLAGVLGTFGLPEGSRIASSIEQLFAGDVPLSEHAKSDLAQHLDELEAIIASKPA
jgi:HPt (histidine-containing phosphotransfer) domain-containing protein